MSTKNERPHFNVVAAIIRKNDLVLITRRLEGRHLAGLWEFPGGKQENGESLERCLEREIEEELGVKIKVGKAVTSVDHSYKHKDITLHVFNCSIIKGEPKGLECQDLRWVNSLQLSEFHFPPPDKEVIEFIFDNDN
jgi:mutator protein MutT